MVNISSYIKKITHRQLENGLYLRMALLEVALDRDGTAASLEANVNNDAIAGAASDHET